MCVCVYICMYNFSYVYLYKCMYICKNVYMYIRIYSSWTRYNIGHVQFFFEYLEYVQNPVFSHVFRPSYSHF